MAKTPEKINETIAELETKLKQAKALKQKIDADRKKAQQELNRKNEDRQKILIGAMILADVSAGRISQKNLLANLSAYLTRPADRALFDFSPLKPPETQSSGSAVQEKAPALPASTGENAPPQAQSGV